MCRSLFLPHITHSLSLCGVRALSLFPPPKPTSVHVRPFHARRTVNFFIKQWLARALVRFCTYFLFYLSLLRVYYYCSNNNNVIIRLARAWCALALIFSFMYCYYVCVTIIILLLLFCSRVRWRDLALTYIYTYTRAFARSYTYAVIIFFFCACAGIFFCTYAGILASRHSAGCEVLLASVPYLTPAGARTI